MTKVVVRTNVANVVRVFNNTESEAIGLQKHFGDTVMDLINSGMTAFYVEEEALNNMQTLISGETIAWVDEDLLQVRVEEDMMAVVIYNNEVIGVNAENAIILVNNFDKNVYLVNKENVRNAKEVALNDRCVFAVELFSNVAAVRA